MAMAQNAVYMPEGENAVHIYMPEDVIIKDMNQIDIGPRFTSENLQGEKAGKYSSLDRWSFE